MTDKRTTEEIAAHLRWTDEHLDADTMDGLSAVNILRDALELARRLEQAEARWQEAEHPFDNVVAELAEARKNYDFLLDLAIEWARVGFGTNEQETREFIDEYTALRSMP